MSEQQKEIAPPPETSTVELDTYAGVREKTQQVLTAPSLPYLPVDPKSYVGTPFDNIYHFVVEEAHAWLPRRDASSTDYSFKPLIVMPSMR